MATECETVIKQAQPAAGPHGAVPSAVLTQDTMIKVVVSSITDRLSLDLGPEYSGNASLV
ncbi:hypothetical protein FRC05_011052 [Tulasnella sp. 425]|nr:hypothetical protein FRC05_011052 [Tulasnella sp. 425]